MIDPIWEKRYNAGVQQRYPWSEVVSFVMRYRPRHKAPEDTHILEIGCGTGGNLWFAAREGFSVTGFDGSPSAVDTAKKRFADEGLHGDIKTALFDQMHLPTNKFDLVIDRGALTCVPFSMARDTIDEIHQSLNDEGCFFFTPFAHEHYVRQTADKVVDGLASGLKSYEGRDYGALSFYREEDVAAMFGKGWSMEEMLKVVQHDVLADIQGRNAEWQVIARKSVS